MTKPKFQIWRTHFYNTNNYKTPELLQSEPYGQAFEDEVYVNRMLFDMYKISKDQANNFPQMIEMPHWRIFLKAYSISTKDGHLYIWHIKKVIG